MPLKLEQLERTAEQFIRLLWLRRSSAPTLNEISIDSRAPVGMLQFCGHRLQALFKACEKAFAKAQLPLALHQLGQTATLFPDQKDCCVSLTNFPRMKQASIYRYMHPWNEAKANGIFLLLIKNLFLLRSNLYSVILRALKSTIG